MRPRANRAMKHLAVSAVVADFRRLAAIRLRASRVMKDLAVAAVAEDLAAAGAVDSVEEDGRVVATTAVAGTTAGVATTAVSSL